jgi:hypothetical protein
LDERKSYTLNEIFGTYPDQGLCGLAFSLLSSDWTLSSKSNKSDFWGKEMHTESPVIKKVKFMYLNK